MKARTQVKTFIASWDFVHFHFTKFSSSFYSISTWKAKHFLI